MNRITLQVQKITAWLLIPLAVLFFAYTLTFMTKFYPLFLEGDSQMYEFFKELQFLNHNLFSSALAFLVLSIFVVPFDLTKKAAGIFGILLAVGMTALNLINYLGLAPWITYFQANYQVLNHEYIEGYQPSIMPFLLSSVLFILAIILCAILSISALYNFIQNRKGGVYETNRTTSV